MIINYLKQVNYKINVKMIILKLKNKDELKAKAGAKNTLAFCGLCPLWNFSKEEIDNLGKDLNAEIVKIPMLCNRPELSMDSGRNIFVLACGAGVQAVADALNKTVIPAADTIGIGVKNKDGSISKYCIACGDCMIDETGSICPKARCEKSLLNGPCAGVHGGLCELSTKETPIKCGWNEICARMVKNGEKDKLIKARMHKVN